MEAHHVEAEKSHDAMEGVEFLSDNVEALGVSSDTDMTNPLPLEQMSIAASAATSTPNEPDLASANQAAARLSGQNSDGRFQDTRYPLIVSNRAVGMARMLNHNVDVNKPQDRLRFEDIPFPLQVSNRLYIPPSVRQNSVISERNPRSLRCRSGRQSRSRSRGLSSDRSRDQSSSSSPRRQTMAGWSSIKRRRIQAVVREAFSKLAFRRSPGLRVGDRGGCSSSTEGGTHFHDTPFPEFAIANGPRCQSWSRSRSRSRHRARSTGRNRSPSSSHERERGRFPSRGRRRSSSQSTSRSRDDIRDLYFPQPASPQGIGAPLLQDDLVHSSSRLDRIKLIKLVPVTDRGGTGHISTPDVTTYEVSLDTDLRYVALSYVWGPEIPQVMIQVDGEPFAIRQNLASAFRQLQVLDPDARIWTDAICINQSDEKEKSRVVQHMGEIYHAAERVYAWLGPPDPGTHLGIGQSSNALWDHLQVIGNLFWRCAGPDSSLDGTLFDINHILTQALPDMTARFAKDPEHGGFPTLAYAAFSNRPYWQRVWVIQEVHLARKLVFCCGDRTMDSKTLAGALILLEAFQKHVVKGDMSADPHLREFAVSSPCYPEMHQLTLYTSIYPSDVHSLRIAMTNFCVKELPRGARATDPRDMIFGLLGFATARERPCIRVDYGKSAQETYRDATLALLQSGFTDVLAWAQPSEKIVQGLPSWVPDFSGTIYEAMCSQHQAKPWLPYFDASAGFHSASNGPKLSPGGELFWPGLVVDKVKKVGSLWYPRLQKDSSAGRVESEAVPDDMRARAATYDEILNYLCEIHSFACESIELHGGPPPGISDLIPDWREAAWRIPCADQLVFDSRPHRNHPAIPLSYESALRDIQTCLRGDGQTIASEEGRRYIETMMRWVKKRPLLCEKGYLGLVPGDTRVGDILVLLEGCSAPYVLRRKQGSEDGEGRIRYQLVGEAYVWGIMDGELTQVGSPEKLFTLV